MKTWGTSEQGRAKDGQCGSREGGWRGGTGPVT